jgi:arylsulfatase A-like enzyme
MRKLGLFALALLGGVLAFSLAQHVRTRLARRPNVLLIIVDTLRADHLSAYGFPFETSPNIDALARRGVLFERPIAASSYTGPSHASIMTCKYPRGHSIGYSNGYLKLTADHTMAESLRGAGYETAAFISNIVIKRKSGLDRGFETFDDDLPQPELNRPEVFERTAEQTTERALAWLAQPRDKPFFLWVHFQDPHGPYTPPAEYAAKFQSLVDPSEPQLRILPGREWYGGIPQYQVLPGLRRRTEYESRYAGEIAYADHWIGSLIAATESRDPSRPAVILFTADHGESLGEDEFYFKHGHSTEPHLVNVPLIVHAPWVSAGRRTELVSHVDIMPTLLEMAGVGVPENCAGMALGPSLRRGTPLPQRIIYSDIGHELGVYRGNEFLRASAPQRDYALMEYYQTGEANRNGRLMGAEDLTDIETFEWNGSQPRRVDGGADQGHLDAVKAYYLAASVSAGSPLHLNPADIERLQRLGYGGPSHEPESK